MFTVCPCILFYIGKISPVSWIFNLLMIPLFTPVLILCVIMIIFRLIGAEFLYSVLEPAYRFLTKLFIGFINAFGTRAGAFAVFDGLMLILGSISLLLAAMTYLIRPKYGTVLIFAASELFLFSVIGAVA